MFALDTNILVRLVTNDDPVQAKQAASLIDSGKPLFVPLTVTLELEWVLRGAYSLSRLAVAKSLDGLLSIRTLTFEKQPDVQHALQHYEAGFDFADALHHAGTSGCAALVTFDRTFEKRAGKTGLIPPVVTPNAAAAS